MRFSSASVAIGLVLTGRGAAVASTVPRAQRGPGYLAVPVGAVSLPQQAEKRDGQSAVETTLDNVNFFYTAQIGIGTPPQNVSVLVDTGSSELWVNPDCRTARPQDRQQCFSFGQYNARHSRTPPSGPFGSETIKFGDSTDSTTVTSVELTYFSDHIAFGAGAIQNQTFGVATQSQGHAQGILGLAPDLQTGFHSVKPYSLVLNSMAKQGMIASRVFALDLRHSDSKIGAIIYGGIDKSKFVGTLEKLPMIRGLEGEFRLAVSLNTLGITQDQARNYQLQGNDTNVMLDSGTTISRLQPDVAMPVLDALRATDDGDGYFQVPCAMRSQRGSVDFGFGGKTINVLFSDFILDLGDASVCYVGIALTGGQQVLGDSVLRAAYVVFDWDNEAVHIAQAADCGDPDIVTVGKGEDAVPSVTGNCRAADVVFTATATQPTTTISRGTGLATGSTATTCPEFDINCGTGERQTQSRSGSQPTATTSDSGSNEDGKSKNSASRGHGTSELLLAVLCGLSVGASICLI